jgi:signal transduction histidine kinase
VSAPTKSVPTLERTLRFQLITIVVITVTVVLVASQWVTLRLSARTLEDDMQQRALLVLDTVRSLLRTSDPRELREELIALGKSARQIMAIDVYRMNGDDPVPAVTTRADSDPMRRAPGINDIGRLRRRDSVMRRAKGPDGEPRWYLAMPLREGTTLVGIAQVEVWPIELQSLKRRLAKINALFLTASVVLISALLAFFLDRRVARPVAMLVDGMQLAGSGRLEARVPTKGTGELAFLARNLNLMLAQIEELNANLEARVREATEHLAEKNRELQSVNERLSAAQLEVARCERFAAVGQMAATIAHELGTPLNSVLGYTQLLLLEELPPPYRDKLTIVESQVKRMIETVHSVLERTRHRRPTLHPVRVDTLIEDAVTLLSARLGEADLVVERRIAEGLPTLTADGVGLRQVLVNLLTNAIDASQPRDQIVLTADLLPPNGHPSRMVELAVRDSGRGLDEEEMRRMFEPLYTTKDIGRGTGLGLAIVDHIVRDHGGELVVESEPQRGTTVRVRLPVEVE